MYAVIRTGGKQYRVAPNDVIEIERLAANAGDPVEFNEVLMVAGEAGVSLGAPFVTGATVAGEVKALTRGPKILIFKKRRRKHFRRKNGHRQDLMEVRITEILTDGLKPPTREGRPETVDAKTTAVAESSTPLPAAVVATADAQQEDDLSQISGVGPKIKKTLNELGFTTFEQIINLTPDQIETIETALKSKGRVVRDEWIVQAQELRDGKAPRAKIDRAKPAKPE